MMKKMKVRKSQVPNLMIFSRSVASVSDIRQGRFLIYPIKLKSTREQQGL
jgi:hypothetical protein